MTSKARFLCDGKAGVRVLRHFWQLSSPVHALFAALKPWRGETDHAFLPSIDPSRRNKYRHTTTVQLLTKKRSIVRALDIEKQSGKPVISSANLKQLAGKKAKKLTGD